jgi:hypothetical protein
VRSLVESGAVELTEANGWTTLVPADRYEALLDFTPRASAAGLMKSYFDQGRLDVHNYARYAFESKRLNRGGIGDWFLGLADRGTLGTSDQTDWKGLQLFGSFTPQEQQMLESGNRFPYSSMGPDQRKIVERIVYNRRLAGVVKLQDGNTLRSDFAVEPTDAYPLGLPGTCAVTAKADSRPVIVAYGKGPDGKVRPLRHLDAWGVAGIEVNVVGNPDKMATYGVANLVGYAPGSIKNLTMRIDVAPEVSASASVSVPEYDPAATPVAWDKLPEKLVKDIAAAMDQVKRQRPGQTGRAIPPQLR